MQPDRQDGVPAGLTRRGFAASLVDQALLSGVSFLTSAVFIWAGDRAEFGVFSLVWSAVQLTLGFQNAVIITPLMTSTPRLRGFERDAFVSELSWLDLKIAGSLALAALLVTWLLCASTGRQDLLLSVGAGTAVIGLWARELRRGRQFADLHAGRVLVGDVVFAGLALAAIGGLVAYRGTILASWGLLAWGVSGICTGYPAYRRSHPRRPDGGSEVLGLMSIVWKQGRWTLPSVSLSWLQGYAYGIIAALTSGAKMVGDLNAARLVAAPASLVQAAWNRVLLPTAGRQIAAGRRAKAVRAGLAGVALVITGCLLYGAGLWVFHTVMHPKVLEDKIRGLGIMVVLWLLWQLVVGVRGVGTALLMAEMSFETLFKYGLLATGTSLALMVVAGSLAGAYGILASMILGELFLCVLIWTRILLGERRPAASRQTV